MFNSFLNDYLKIFNSCFPLQTVIIKNNFTKNKWITKGIKIYCNNKRKLYLNYRENPNKEIKKYYRLYSKILTNVIKEAKKIYYSRKVLTSSNKCKATWDIINEITGHRHTKIDPQGIKVDHKHITNPEEIAELFNKYFSAQGNDGIEYESQSNSSNEAKAKCYFNQDNKLYSTSFIFKTFST
jgi:CRISPR/Cas system-associated exonuclease Cas4 (RecB family)